MPIPGITRVKELFGQFIAKGKNAAGTPIAILAENDGTPRVQLVAWDGAQERVVNETSGRLAVVAYGKDSGANEDPLRTNANQQLQVEVVNDTTEWQQIDPVLLTASEADLWDPAGDGSILYEVVFAIVNVDGTNNTTASVGVDVGDTGSVAAKDWIFKAMPINVGAGLLFNQITLPSDDVIRGLAADADRASIHFTRVKRVN